jgi:PAS domain S-box-containing protein
VKNPLSLPSLGADRRRQLRRAITGIALVLVPLMMLSVYLSMHREFRDADALRETTLEALATRDALSDLLVMHVDAETGVRGFVLTGKPLFLGPYDAALKRRDGIFDRLAQTGNAQIVRALPTLRALSDEKMELGARNIADMRAGRALDARARVASGVGKRAMDRIRAQVAAMDAAERAILLTLSRQAADKRASVERTVTAMLVGLALVLLLVTIVVARSSRLRSEALDHAQTMRRQQAAMFDSALDGMMVLDEQARILRINNSITRMFGYERGDLLGQSNTMLMKESFTPEQSEGWLRRIGVADIKGAGQRQEFTGVRADGSEFATEAAVSRIPTHNTGERRYIAVIRDISERKRAERMKTEFVSTVSHELRTPLTSIGGSLSLLAAGAVGRLDEKPQRLVDIARSNCERLIRLINDILDIEKIESGNMHFDMRRMQIAPLVRRTVGALESYAQQHEVDLTVSVPPWPQCITGDPDRLEQLLTNLVSNAIKHAPVGSEVEIFCHDAGGRAVVEVRDRGNGVPMAFRSRIFGKFAMADASDSRAKGGTGLGLAIAREIARRHDGEVDFADREGGGTVFHFAVPLASGGVGAQTPAPDPSLPVIVHVDDDEDTLSVVARAFGARANVLSLASLAEARAALDRHEVDAVILDAALPGENGLDLLADLDGRHRRVPVILFTATDEGTGVPGIDRVLVKSRASIDDLVQATFRLLDRRRKAA